jgi:hypothetical protein
MVLTVFVKKDYILLLLEFVNNVLMVHLGMDINVMEEMMDNVKKDGNGTQIENIAKVNKLVKIINNGMVFDADANKDITMFLENVKHAQMEQFSMVINVLQENQQKSVKILIHSGMDMLAHVYLGIGH